MKKVYILAAIAAVLFGALMFLYLHGTGGEAESSSVEMKTVVVATCDIAADVTITEDMVQEEKIPASQVQVNRLTSKDEAVGKCCPAQIVKGQQLQSNMLADPGTAGVRLSAQLDDGMFGMSVKVKTEGGVAGYVKAGDRIDLLGAVVDADGNVISTGKVVENVEVVRVNEATEEGTTPYDYLTLSMTEEQCRAVYAYQVVSPYGASTEFYAILRAAGGTQ